MSGENTVHHLHLMNEWIKQVPGICIDDHPKAKWKNIIQSCLETFSSDHEIRLRHKNSIYSTLWREKMIFGYVTEPVEHILCGRYKDNYLKYFFGDLEHHFELVKDYISYEQYVLIGAFTFSKDLKLKSGSN